MGPGVAAVRLPNSVQERTTQRGGRRFVKAATTRNASRVQGDIGGGSFFHRLHTVVYHPRQRAKRPKRQRDLRDRTIS